MVDWVEPIIAEPWKYNKCRFCGSPVEKPREFCDEICEKGFKIKSLIPELADIPISGVNKARFHFVLKIAEALKSGKSEREIKAVLGLFYASRTLNYFLA